ncbi:acyl-CoA N-acyltransferase [Crassisporium funariophilum]|nr:acyl-CoA N-acyltransferase [Crassisporium funariophilum]
MSSSTDIVYDYVPLDDLDKAIEIEQQGYPADEAGSAESFRLRQSQAGTLFLGAYQVDGSSRTLIAYICSTLSPATSRTHESMSTLTTHIPGSSSVCIHSVCVSGTHRHQGIGLALLKEYISRLEQANIDGSAKYERVLLITHENLRGFYEQGGFEWVGPSPIVHGSKPWFEMRRNLTRGDSTELSKPVHSETQLPPGVWEALQRRPDIIPSSRQISDFPNGLADVLTADGKKQGVSHNKFDLLCPRAGCGSIILKNGVGEWVERSSVQLEPTGSPENPHLSPLPTPPETAQWWLITGSPMAFENIGFTRPVQSLTNSGPKLKLLICGECDLGPLGWSEEGGSEFWLACSRVCYRG